MHLQFCGLEPNVKSDLKQQKRHKSFNKLERNGGCVSAHLLMADVCDFIGADRNRDTRPFTSRAAWNDLHILQTTAEQGGLWKYLLCEPLNPQPRPWISPCYYTCKQ